MKVDDSKLPFCSHVKDIFASGRTVGIFQLEAQLGQTWSRKLRPENIEHLSALLSLLRPGCLKAKDERGVSMTENFVRRRHGIEAVPPFHPVVDAILANTFGIIVYQEQSMQIAKDVAGFNLQEADTLRKCVTKDTMFVSKQRGWVTIKELLETGYESDEFLIMDKNGKQQWKKIEKIWKSGDQAARRVQSSSGFYVDATKHHQFLTSSGWKARLRLTEADNLIAAKSVCYDGRDVISRDLAIVIAGILTEGYFVERNGTFVSHDDFMMETFCKAYQNVFNEVAKKNPDGKVVYINKEKREYLSKWIEYGKSDSRKLPKEMMGMTLETTREFLSFILAAEGGTTQSSGTFDFNSKSHELAYQVKLLLLRFGIRSNLLKKSVPDRNDDYWITAIGCQEDRKKLLASLTILWPNSKIDELISGVEGRKECGFTSDSIPSHISISMIDQYPGCVNYEGGSVYKGRLTRDKFKRIAERTQDKEWMDIAGGHQVYEPVESVTEKHKQIDVYDFTVAGGDTPYIIANGLVIHNSIGKKLPEEMAKVKKLFLDKASALKVVSEEQASHLFEIIEHSNRYSFNLAHAYAYARRSLKTAYAKAHFPVQFYTAWLQTAKLKADIGDEDQIATLIEDARYFGVTTLVPDLVKSKANALQEGNSVRLGLCDAGGVGEAGALKIQDGMKKHENEIGEPPASWPWERLLLFVLADAPASQTEPLLATGAVASWGKSRLRALSEWRAVCRMSPGELKWARKNYREGESLVDILEGVSKTKKEGGGCQKAERAELLKAEAQLLRNPPSCEDDTPEIVAELEKRYLGVSVTFSRLDGMDTSNATMSCADYLNERRPGRIAAEVRRINKIMTKKGTEMAFLTVSDHTGSLNDCVVFSEALEAHRGLLRVGSRLLFTGGPDQNAAGFIINNVSLLTNLNS